MNISKVDVLVADKMLRTAAAKPVIEQLAKIVWPDCVGCIRIELAELFEKAGATVARDERVWMEQGEMATVDLVCRAEQDGKRNAYAFQVRESEVRRRDCRPMRWADGFPVQIVFVRNGPDPVQMRGWEPQDRPDYVILCEKRSPVPDHEHRCRKLVIIKPGGS